LYVWKTNVHAEIITQLIALVICVRNHGIYFCIEMRDKVPKKRRKDIKKLTNNEKEVKINSGI
jgi:hypothetical protein